MQYMAATGSAEFQNDPIMQLIASGVNSIMKHMKMVFVQSNSAYYTQDHLAYLAQVDDEIMMAGHVSNYSTTTFDLRHVVHSAIVDMNPLYIHMSINGTPDTYCHPSDSLVNYRMYPTVSGCSMVSTSFVHQGEDGCH